jgi:hypothetical protein
MTWLHEDARASVARLTAENSELHRMMRAVAEERSTHVTSAGSAQASPLRVAPAQSAPAEPKTPALGLHPGAPADWSGEPAHARHKLGTLSPRLDFMLGQAVKGGSQVIIVRLRLQTLHGRDS